MSENKQENVRRVSLLEHVILRSGVGHVKKKKQKNKRKLSRQSSHHGADEEARERKSVDPRVQGARADPSPSRGGGARRRHESDVQPQRRQERWGLLQVVASEQGAGVMKKGFKVKKVTTTSFTGTSIQML